MNTDGTGNTLLWTTVQAYFQISMAVDPIRGFLYFGSSASQILLRIPTTNPTATFQIAINGIYPNGLAVDLSTGSIYYPELGGITRFAYFNATTYVKSTYSTFLFLFIYLLVSHSPT